MTESDKQNLDTKGLFQDKIDLVDLYNTLWKEKKLIIAITSLVAIGSVIFSISLTNYYTSESSLISRSSQDSGGLLSEYSGLASLAGVGLPGSKESDIVEVMEIIESRDFVKHLITFEGVLPSIMAAESYDISSQELYFDPDIYDEATKTWTREPQNNNKIIPSYLEAHEEYLGIMSLSKDQTTGLVSMSIEHKSPFFAKELLELIIKEVNNLRREDDIEEADMALRYLKEELSRTPQVAIKGSINELIKNQLETRIMAKVNEEYSLIIIEPPFIPEKKSKPNRGLICILSTLIAGVLSSLFVLVRRSIA